MCVRSQEIEISPTSTIMKGSIDNITDDGVGKIKGIKTKERVRGSSSRPKGALEKLKKRRKSSQEVFKRNIYLST